MKRPTKYEQEFEAKYMPRWGIRHWLLIIVVVGASAIYMAIDTITKVQAVLH